MIRQSLLITFLLIHVATLSTAQETGRGVDIVDGKFKVGFSNYQKNDKSRSYKRLYDWNNKVLARPISISTWYPAKKVSAKNRLTVNSYMKILKQEEEWESLPDERILSWFYYADNESNRQSLAKNTDAYSDAPATYSKFPIVIYAPSYQASSVENFALCESLASHGYIVMSCPSRGTDNRLLDGGTTRDIETQARDIEFLIAEAVSSKNADPGKIAVIGFSFGGISNVLAQMQDQRIKALVCLDGSIKYQFQKLLASDHANIDKVDVPFLFMSQKNIPRQVMVEDKIDPTLNDKFAFFDSLKYSLAYHFKFNDLTHPYFTSMGVVFQERDLRQDKSDKEIMASYRWVNQYTLNFLNAFLKDDKNATDFLRKDPVDNGVSPGLISVMIKQPVKKAFLFEDFNALAIRSRYEHLEALVKILKDQHPALQLPEWKLNNLGLQLLFQGKEKEAINLLSLNTVLYPKSANAFDSLAEAYLLAGQKDLAIKNFNLSLELDPTNSNARDKLKGLLRNN